MTMVAVINEQGLSALGHTQQRAERTEEHLDVEMLGAVGGHFANLPRTPAPHGLELKPRAKHNRPTGWGAPASGVSERGGHYESPDRGEDVGEEAEE